MTLNKKQIEELEELAKPLNEWMQNNCHPCTHIILEIGRIELHEGVVGIPLPIKD